MTAALVALRRGAERGWLPATLGLLAVVTALSLSPLTGMQDAAPGGDKVQHLIAYAALAFPSALAAPRRWPLILAALAAWSWGIELAQPLVGRSNHLADLAANVAGLALGAFAGTVLGRLSRRRG